MRILIATDAFPPASGGSGWSTYELAKGLRARGHSIAVVQPYSERDPVPPGFDGFAVEGFPAFAPRVPFVRNYVRNERLYRRFGGYLEEVIRREKIDLIHAQHMLTGPAAVIAAERTGIPSVCTVRDYWPLCYWSDLLDDPGSGSVCPGCSSSAMTRCVRPRAGSAWPLALPAIPYMRSNLLVKQQALARADVVIAVSGYVASELRRRAPDLARTRIEVVPNAVDVAGVRRAIAATSRPLAEPYALFVGKLAKNKGSGSLVEAIRRARLDIPLVVIGDGPERQRVVRDAAAAGVDVRVMGWLDRTDVFRWLGHAVLLIFPSTWPEPLSRVLIEAGALSIPVAAMNTGGTPDIVIDEETGLLSATVEELAVDARRLAADAQLRARLGSAAGKRAESRFDTATVIARMEELYSDALA